jgi:hypothetical protein
MKIVMYVVTRNYEFFLLRTNKKNYKARKHVRFQSWL